jgi:hypothetical protein
VECLFGTTRSTLSGKTRWESFFLAEINAVLITERWDTLGSGPDIRHFTNEAGCTLAGSEQHIADAEFHNPNLDVMFLVEPVWNPEGQKPRGSERLMNMFISLSGLLGEAGSSEKAGKSNLLSGGCLALRF